MSHPLQLNYDSKVVELRASQLFLELKDMEARGEIATRTGQLQEFYHRLHRFYDTIGRPLFTAREADMLPSSAAYNQMLNELLKDLELLYIEVGHIRNNLDASFLESEIDRAVLDERLRRSEDRLLAVDANASGKTDDVVFRDGFMDNALRDDTRVLDRPARTWTREGILTLHPKQATSHIESATLRIHSGNGLPGNTKQANASAGEIRFVGEEALHLNLADLLDGNADTWFEYERFRLAKEATDALRGYGLTYAEGVAWASTDDAALTLVLEVDLPEAVPVNWLSLRPFVPSDRGAKAAEVVSIEVQDGQGHIFRPLSDEASLENEKVYLFGRKLCKRVLITLQQPHGYATEVGHRYYQEIETESLSYMERMKQQPGKRLPGEDPSVTALGLDFDHAAQQLIHPPVTKDFVYTELDKFKDALFRLPDVPEADLFRVKNGLELVPAHRQAIGLRDLGVANYEFQQTSDYVSVPFATERDIVGISLSVDQEIPQEFPEGEWLRYWVSPDDGENWHRIHPRGVTKAGAKLLYLFNTFTPTEGRIESFGYVDLDKPVRSVRLRVELERPVGFPDAECYTPILRSYELHAVLGGA